MKTDMEQVLIKQPHTNARGSHLGQPIMGKPENNIILYQDENGELPTDSTCKKYLRVQTEGKRQVERSIDHYNLDMIIAIGYRVQSQIASNDLWLWQIGLLHWTIRLFPINRLSKKRKKNLKHTVLVKCGRWKVILIVL